MKVSFVVESNYPVDREVRTRKMAKSLSNRGHDVTIFARSDQDDPARGQIRDGRKDSSENIGYATVRRFSILAGTPLQKFLIAALPFNPFWVLWLVFWFRREHTNIVISNDIRAGPTSIVGAKLLHIPVVVDVRENYVELARLLDDDSMASRIKTHPKVIGTIEHFLYRFSDALWVVTEERKSMIVDAGFDSAKIKVVHNSPNLTEQSVTSDRNRDNDFSWTEFTIVYVGILNDFRGLDLIIEALAELESEPTEFQLAIAGDGPYKSKLEQKCQELNVCDNVTFVGWIEPQKIPEFLSAGNLGVIPHWVTGFTNTTVPNKLFDYMLAELPVLATDMDPIRRIINDANCGTIISDNTSPETVASQIKTLAASSDLEGMGANGRRAVKTRYNWDYEMDTVKWTIDLISS